MAETFWIVPIMVYKLAVYLPAFRNKGVFDEFEYSRGGKEFNR